MIGVLCDSAAMAMIAGHRANDPAIKEEQHHARQQIHTLAEDIKHIGTVLLTEPPTVANINVLARLLDEAQLACRTARKEALSNDPNERTKRSKECREADKNVRKMFKLPKGD